MKALIGYILVLSLLIYIPKGGSGVWVLQQLMSCEGIKIRWLKQNQEAWEVLSSDHVGRCVLDAGVDCRQKKRDYFCRIVEHRSWSELVYGW